MKIRDFIDRELYIVNNKIEPNLKKKAWYEITKKSTDKNVSLRRIGTSKILEIPMKSFIDGRVAGHFLFIDEML
jgi:hypothetical protein